MDTIKIKAVLALIDSGAAFSMTYAKTNGIVRHLSGVRKASASASQGEKKGEGKVAYSFRERGCLLLRTEGEKNPKAYKVACITHFNGVLIDHQP